MTHDLSNQFWNAADPAPVGLNLFNLLDRSFEVAVNHLDHGRDLVLHGVAEGSLWPCPPRSL